jgi:dTDP-4-amino-4,6-dideoxygalactose transaminase
MFDKIFEFERALAEYTGAPYVIMTDCCTHAIELCLRYDRVKNTKFSAFTYLSIPMTMEKLNVRYTYTDEEWVGEYPFHWTRIWDSARRLERGMYREGQMQCLSFGHSKPLQIGRGGAILLDDVEAYDIMIQQRYDGRRLNVTPWQDQYVFRVGYHYKPTIEEAERGLELLPLINETPKKVEYPDCRKIIIE